MNIFSIQINAYFQVEVEPVGEWSKLDPGACDRDKWSSLLSIHAWVVYAPLLNTDERDIAWRRQKEPLPWWWHKQPHYDDRIEKPFDMNGRHVSIQLTF